MVYTPQPTRPGGGGAATWPSNTLYYIHYFPTNCKTRISCSLKRFLRTTGQKTVTTCAGNVLARTPKQVVPDFSMYKTSPGGDDASGGSLRSSRQAVA